MKFDIGLAISRAFGYSTNLNRLLAFTGFFVLGALFVLAPLVFFYGDIAMGGLTAYKLIGAFAWLLLGIAVAYLIYTYVSVLFTENYASRKPLSKSAAAVRSVYFTFLMATFLTAVISGIAGMVPAVGFILSIIAALIFYFVPQEVVIGKSGLDSLSRSYDIFMKNKLEVFVAVIVGAIASLVIFLVFLIPLVLAGMLTLVTAISTGSFVATLLANLPMFIATGLIALVGLALATLFGNSFRTDAYLQITKAEKGKPRKK